ncbi:MAG: co-chaperone DjlA [Legionellales bacterium]|nr:co-chaperone DjlA [Legionellales bacterium]|tara:strand:- start:2770 stop:3534 length:765 start_codon:yes stop_codon:yes gene_type:complete
MIWGRLFGTVMGLVLIKGLLGAIVGYYIGRQFDYGVMRHQYTSHHSHSQQVFFDITFSVMGHLAKADGKISSEEIQMAQQTMRLFNLSDQAKKQAINAFNTGKSADFNLDQALTDLKRHIGLNIHLYRIFYEIQTKITQIDGHVSPKKMQKLDRIRDVLFGRYQQQSGYGRQQYQGFNRANRVGELDQAYHTLGVTPETPWDDIKKAYKKLMLKNHPDRLVSQGLPEEMLNLAKEKTQAIKAAYDTIKTAKMVT